MVQKSSAKSVGLGILLRILFLVLALGIGVFFFPFTIHDFVVNTLGYQKPSGFFGYSFADWEIAWLLCSVLWAGIIFGTLGKKVDYIFFSVIFFFTLWDYSYPPAVPFKVYLGLMGGAAIGNVIGFGLKLARQRFFKDSWIGR